MKENIKDLLFRSFEGLLTVDEEKQLSEALQNSAELREEKRRISETRQKISESAETKFSPFFAEKIMINIESLDSCALDLDLFGTLAGNMFRRFLLAGTAAAVLLLTFNLLSSENISILSLIFGSDVTVSDMIDPLLAYNPGTF